jgi:hypothetical protein
VDKNGLGLVGVRSGVMSCVDDYFVPQNMHGKVFGWNKYNSNHNVVETPGYFHYRFYYIYLGCCVICTILLYTVPYCDYYIVLLFSLLPNLVTPFHHYTAHDALAVRAERRRRSVAFFHFRLRAPYRNTSVLP